MTTVLICKLINFVSILLQVELSRKDTKNEFEYPKVITSWHFTSTKLHFHILCTQQTTPALYWVLCLHAGKSLPWRRWTSQPKFSFSCFFCKKKTVQKSLVGSLNLISFSSRAYRKIAIQKNGTDACSKLFFRFIDYFKFIVSLYCIQSNWPRDLFLPNIQN